MGLDMYFYRITYLTDDKPFISVRRIAHARAWLTENTTDIDLSDKQLVERYLKRFYKLFLMLPIH